MSWALKRFDVDSSTSVLTSGSLVRRIIPGWKNLVNPSVTFNFNTALTVIACATAVFLQIISTGPQSPNTNGWDAFTGDSVEIIITSPALSGVSNSIISSTLVKFVTLLPFTVIDCISQLAAKFNSNISCPCVAINFSVVKTRCGSLNSPAESTGALLSQSQ